MEFVRQGGFGMYPVMVFGLIGLGLAFGQWIAPARARLALIVGLVVLTALSGLLGTATGIRNTLVHIATMNAEGLDTLAIGIRESLHCTILGFALAVFQTLVATTGTYRWVVHEDARTT